jgi:hypothetical protein
MADVIVPIREISEEEAIAWLKAQDGGRTSLRPFELAQRFGWPQCRLNRRLKKWAKDGLVVRRGDAIKVADAPAEAGAPQAQRKAHLKSTANAVQFIDNTPEKHVRVLLADAASGGSDLAPPSTAIPTRIAPRLTTIDVLAYGSAITLAGAAAFFSIKGMVVLFPGAPAAVVWMTITMETAKLVAAAWVARRWRATGWIWRFALIAFITGLAVINATGVYAQLVAAHVGERGAAQSAIEAQDAALAARAELAAQTVADLDRRQSQIDSAIEEAAKRGRTNTALSAIEGQKKARAGLVDERRREASILADLKTERAALAAKGRQIDTEAAPIRYVAELIGADTDSERAIRWLIALMVLCCDPLAIALTASASARR